MPNAPEPSTPAEIARGAIEVVCSGDLDRLSEFYDPQFVDHVNDMVFYGHDRARESVSFYRSIFSGLRFEVLDQFSERDRVATRWRLHGTYRARQITVEGIVLSTIRDGRIVEDHSATDSLALVRALGALRTTALLVDVLRGKVLLPRGALRARCGPAPAAGQAAGAVVPLPRNRDAQRKRCDRGAGFVRDRHGSGAPRASTQLLPLSLLCCWTCEAGV